MIFTGSLKMEDGILSGELRDQTGYRIPLCATLVRDNGKVVRIELTGSGEMPQDMLLPHEPGYVPSGLLSPPAPKTTRRRR